MNQAVMQRILELEWEMFSDVQNAGGRASCQDDAETFKIMRGAQFATWPEDALESWLEDLEAARREGRNLMTEKYARMMESTCPEEYMRIAKALPPVDGGTLALIEEILAAHISWKLEAAEKYPFLCGRGRALRSGEDSALETSFETYLRGELRTCSAETIRRLHRHTLRQQKAGINGAAETLLQQAKRYGYASLAEAENAAAPARPAR
ncbi:MAG: DUF4125 family protein [Desulfovibrio sp.]|jgi:hypothetical protein|nr:DUF4125 family protein [Desulfovibrio sp.]